MAIDSAVGLVMDKVNLFTAIVLIVMLNDIQDILKVVLIFSAIIYNFVRVYKVIMCRKDEQRDKENNH